MGAASSHGSSRRSFLALAGSSLESIAGASAAAPMIPTPTIRLPAIQADAEPPGEMAGGGSLPDVGIYRLNATRFLSGEEPVEVMAQIHTTPNDPRFRGIEETVHFRLR